MDLALELVVTPGLGDNSYLIASGSDAALVDPQRDVGRLLATAETRGARVRYVLETHVHNDYISGAAEVRAAVGAEVAGPAGAGYAFPFVPLADGDELAIGDLRLVALATPGHTPEHTSYAVLDPDSGAPVAVFSGGSLIVGSAGRSDLLGPDRAESLARAQYGSMRRLAALPDAALLLPTHGAGSFCASGPPDDERTSTIGRERGVNPALLAPDEDTFVREQLADLLAHPAYYAHMAPINRAGPVVFGAPPVPSSRSPAEVVAALEAGARLVDTRPGAVFARAHVPGSLNVPLEDSFGSYVGWLVPFGAQLVLIADDHASRAEAAVQLFRIGYDRVLGHLDGGIDAWADDGRAISSYPVADLDELVAQAREARGRILDVRQRTEWETAHVPGSRHCFIGDLPSRVHELVAGSPLTVACASGYRAAMAASVLHAAGASVRLVADGGVPDAMRRLAGRR